MNRDSGKILIVGSIDDVGPLGRFKCASAGAKVPVYGS